MKKILSKFLLALVLIFFTTIFSNNVFASTNSEFTYEDYLKGIEDGWIGEDVSYEMLLKLREESKALEEQFINSEDFYEVELIDRLQSGDIIITNATSSSGYFGHAGIAIGSDTILHIAGIGKVPDTRNIEWFRNKYKDGWIKVYRARDSYLGLRASKWAKNTYEDSNAKYMITTNLKSTDVTYCSKIVWQGYYFGAGSNSVNNTNTFRIVTPYALKDGEIRDVNFQGDL